MVDNHQASIPDMDKILKLSRLFEVSTDYLLKDEIVEENEKIPKAEEAYCRQISSFSRNSYRPIGRLLRITSATPAAARISRIKMILAEKIALLRKRNEWSQEQLAEKLDISRQSVSK
mgnify:CR=1 FL=1